MLCASILSPRSLCLVLAIFGISAWCILLWSQPVYPPSTRLEKPESWTEVDTEIPIDYIYNDVEKVHRVISSVSTASGSYFMLDFSPAKGYNPSIIPHPSLNDTWIMVAQYQDHSVEHSVWWAQMVCNAQFTEDGLQCLQSPLILPIAATFGEGTECPPELAYLKFNVGPHDARVFWGPTKPYVIYGSNSRHPCLGQWIQDFRLLVDWGYQWEEWDEFKYGTELMRPDKWGRMEKNWFLFWDFQNQSYVHHDIWPQRVFAKLDQTGKVGPDLAPSAKDGKCMAEHMPPNAHALQSIHQTTNSLSITMCNRSDPECTVSESNTYVFTIFQHKSYYQYHANYEPYVMVFHRSRPFHLYGISKKPLFIKGRTRPGDDTRPAWLDKAHYAQTEMFYVTSMSWKAHEQRYHGFLDDTLFLAFGVEDQKAAAIDVKANDLFHDLAIC